MGINSPSDIAADLSIGATDQGAVRLFIVAHLPDGPVEIPMDFAPDEAAEIAREITAAAERAARNG